MTFEWWWISAGLGVLGFLLLFKPAHGPLWPFLLMVPILLITGLFAFFGQHSRHGISVFLNRDAVFQILFAARFACAILTIILANRRRIAAVPLAMAGLLADPILFGYLSCAVGAPLCM